LKKLPDRERRQATDDLRRTASPEGKRPAPQLRSNELLELEQAGIAIGNHTYDHPCLDRCTAAEVVAQVTSAHEQLESILGHHPAAFAYPNGNYDAGAAAALRNLGYDAAFLFDHQLSEVPVPDRFAISRVRVNSYTPRNRFHTILSGLHPALHRLRGRH
jgi:peptidoglycan/xylan/chitin deacetylase (PgdA/CDA1 family)